MSDTKTIKIKKRYERRVSLDGILNKYDHISCLSEVEAEIEFSDQEEMKKKLDGISKLVRSEVERDIKGTISYIGKLKKDKKNQAVLGTGGNTLDGEKI